MTPEDFDSLYAAAAPRLVGQVLAMCGDRAEAQDVVQEAFMRAWQHRATLDAERSPEAWVRTTAHRLAVSRWRKERNALLAASDIRRGGDRRRRRQRLAVAGSTLAAAALVGGVVLSFGLRGPEAGTQLPGGAPTSAAVPSPSSPSTPAPSGSASSSPVGGKTAVTVVLPAGQEAAFASPSGNIACLVMGTSVRCEIVDKTWNPPPKPASCEFDWGVGMSLEGGSAAYLCISDTVRGLATPGSARTGWSAQGGSVPVTGDAGQVALDYGTTLRSGTVSCTSEADGMHCTDSATGHGFDLSREAGTLR